MIRQMLDVLTFASVILSYVACSRQKLLLCCMLALPLVSTDAYSQVSTDAYSQWSGELDTNIYHTDDIGLFSVTRRLSLLEDPTQPVVDRPNQGQILFMSRVPSSCRVTVQTSLLLGES